MNKYSINGELTKENIDFANQQSLNEEVILVLPTTKGINPNLLLYARNNVTFSITGGLNPQKDKFNNIYYQRRTYYSGRELYFIIKKYEEIERGINPMWSDLEKATYYYGKLCNYFTYNENTMQRPKQNYPTDAARNLLGILNGQSVCSGFALIFKEAMDRIGVECIYQNRESHHSWNIIKAEDRYYGVELTWDVDNKKGNNCQFYCFGSQNKDDFYNNKHHNIDDETEETKYPLEILSRERLNLIIKKVLMQQNISQKIGYNSPCSIITPRNTIEITDKHRVYIKGSDEQNFVRYDGSSFVLIPTGRTYGRVKEYFYGTTEGDNFKGYYISSDSDLLTLNLNSREFIANVLLSKERLKTKLSEFNGYIGYIIDNKKELYYDDNFEKKALNVYR